MTAAFVQFTYEPSSDRPDPEWRFNGTLQFQIDAEVLAEIYGPVGDATLEEVFEQNKASVYSAATRKVQHLQQRPSEPVLLNSDDFFV